MHQRLIRRATVAAIAALLATTVAVFADTVPADGDAVAMGNQTVIDLGQAGPGQVVTWPVQFHLTCGSFSHAAAGSTIQLDQGAVGAPDNGAISATSTTIGVPADWTPDGDACPFPAPSIAADAPSVVTLTMPTLTAIDDLFTVSWTRSPLTGLTSITAITFKVDVVPNTPPHLTLPAAQTVEATGPGGAVATFSATATDAEDAVAPTPACVPPSGSTFPLGTTTVNCTVTDGGGLSDSGSFQVTVVDTTAPSLVGMPAAQHLTTGNPGGTTLTYTAPGATDTVDPVPTISCAPASGSPIPVGTTTVKCTATDASGNHSSASFDVSVTFLSQVAWSAVWGEPVASPGDTFVANGSRTIPVKVEIFANGVERTSGRAVLSIVGCAGGTTMTMALSWDGGRWNGHLDTSLLSPGCYRVTVSLDGNAAGSFRLDIRGDSTAASSKTSNATTLGARARPGTRIRTAPNGRHA